MGADTGEREVRPNQMLLCFHDNVVSQVASAITHDW